VSLDERFNARLLVGGVDRVWTKLEQTPKKADTQAEVA